MAMVSEAVDMASDNIPESPRSSARGAQFALQVALQTMKERCQQLQRRLASLEDENIALRRQVARTGSDERSTSSGPDSLREQVAVLSLQKAQLSQQMQMVAAENRQLWLRLSRLYQANQSLGSHLSRISDTLKQHSTSPPTCQGEGDASLEEISLKLANSIMQEKMDLEQQCAQMTEMQNHEGGPSSPLDLQTLAAEGDGSEALLAHYRRLSEVRDMLRGHQSSLRAGIEALRNVEQARQNAEEEESRQISSLREWGEAASQPRHSGAIKDWTCPMCAQYFPITSVKFDVFHAHVSAHFVPEEDDPALTFDFIN